LEKHTDFLLALIEVDAGRGHLAQCGQIRGICRISSDHEFTLVVWVRAGRVLLTLVRLVIFRYCQIMASRSIGNIDKKRKRGRPPTEATPVLVRVMPTQIERLDAWIAKQGEPELGRPEAIRRLLDQVLPPASRKKGR
jgi:hypothetical protein